MALSSRQQDKLTSKFLDSLMLRNSHATTFFHFNVLQCTEESLLMKAVKRRMWNMVTILLDSGADINFADVSRLGILCSFLYNIGCMNE